MNVRKEVGQAVQAPQIFHDKEERSKHFVSFPSDLFAAINQTCNGNEAKVLLTLLGCKGDGSFAPSTAYVQRMSGISKPNNYYATRKNLETKGFLTTDKDGNLYIDTQKILAKAAKQINESKTNQKEPSAGQG